MLQSRQLLDLFLTQSLDGFYIAEADDPFHWNESVDKAAAVEHFLDHMRIRRVNAAMLAQYQAVESDFVGKPIRSFFAHDLENARTMIREFLDAGRIRQETLEYKPDGSPVWIEGDYLSTYDADGRISGHFGIQRDVTERKAMDAALRENEAHIRMLFDAVNDGIFLHDLETGRILDINQKALDMYGYSREEILQLEVGQLSEGTPPFSQMDALAHIRRAAEGEPQLFEWRGRRKSGQTFWVQVNMRKAVLKGKPRLLVTVRDVDAGKSTERALENSEERYQGLFLNSPDSIFWVAVQEDGVFRVESINPAQEALIGLSNQEVAGRRLQEFLPIPVADSIEARYRNCVQCGRPVTYEEEADLGAGIRYFQTQLVPIRDITGRIHRLAGVSKEVTDQRRAEDAIRERERLFRLLFEQSGDANLLIDGNLFVDCNEATVKVLGAQHKEELLKTHPSQLSPPLQPDGRDSHEKADAMIATAFRVGSHRFEWMHQKLDGTELPVDVRLTAIPWQGKWILHTTWRDLTESKRVEEERQALERQMQQAQRLDSLGILAGGIAHDFNNLLTALLGNLNLAHLTLSGDSPALPYLDSAENTVLRASELTKQMLAYSGRGHFVVKLHDLNKVVQEMAHLLQVSIPKKIVLNQFLAENLPPVEADGAQIQQVILNLVTNAADAIGKQDGVISLATESLELDQAALSRDFPAQTLAPGPYVSLEVRDTGCGIPPETLAHIFEPFFTTKPTGRGLGLSAMLGILRGHRAGIRIQSKVGAGSTFTLIFPAQKGLVEVAPKEQALPSEGAHETILLVDDEPMILETAKAALEGMGYRVIAASDGLEAMERFREHREAIALVIMDLTMPRMDGREAFEAMLAIQPTIRVVLSSGYSEQESVPQLLGRGLAGFLPKPYPISELRRIVQDSLRRPC